MFSMQKKPSLSQALCAACLTMAACGGTAQAQLDPFALYNQQFWLLTHNSYANEQQGYLSLWQNQRKSVYQQLVDGVRVINLDIWMVKQYSLAGTYHFLYQDNKTLEWKASIGHATDLIFDYSDVTPEIVCGHEIGKWGYLLLKGGGTNYLDTSFNLHKSKHRPLTEYLWQIQRFLAERPDQVVTISFESYVTDAALLRKAFQETHLLDKIFYADRPNDRFYVDRLGVGPGERIAWEVKKHGWPTVNEMIANRRNLVIFTDNPTTSEKPNGDGMPSYDDYAVASVGGKDCFNPKKCNGRALGSADLFDHTRNLFEMSWTNDVLVLNGANLLDNRNQASHIYDFWFKNHFQDPDTGTWNPRCGRVPNFLSVDFYDIGGLLDRRGPLSVQHDFQAFWSKVPPAPTYVRAMTSTGPLVNGWYRGNVTLRIANYDVNQSGYKSDWVHVCASQMRAENGFSYGENRGEEYLTYTGADQETKDYTIGAEGRTLVTYYGINTFGRTSNLKASVVKIDKTPPRTVLVTYNDAGENANTLKKVVLSASDGASGIDKTFYQLDGGPEQVWTREIPLGPGLHTLRYYSVDKAGWVEPAQTSQVLVGSLSDDVTAPLTTMQTYQGGSSRGPVLFVDLTATDVGAFQTGVTSTLFSLDERPWEPFQRGWLMFDQGWHTLDYSSTDRAGNQEEPKRSTFFVGLDYTPPLTTLTTAQQGKGVQVTLTAEDGGDAPSPPSGIQSIHYIVDNSQNQLYRAPFLLLRGRHTVAVQATDRLGNVEPWRTIPVVQGPLDVSNQYITFTAGSLRYDRLTGIWKQPVLLTNVHPTETVTGPISLVVRNLPADITLDNATGTTKQMQPLGQPYVDYVGTLAPGESTTITLAFRKPLTSRAAIQYSGQILAYPGNR